MKQRIATMVDPQTSEVRKVLRGTPEYIDLKNSGWESQEQLSHKKYRRDYEPDYTEEPEETTTDVDERELLKNRISEMYDKVYGKIDDIPDEKFYHKTRTWVDYSQQKEVFYNMIDDLYAEMDNDFEFDKYIDSQMPTINALINVIIEDSDQYTVDMAITQLANILQRHSLDPMVSRMLGTNDDFFGEPLGVHSNSSNVKDRY